MPFSGRHRSKIPPLAQLEGNFLESQLPVRAFGTLTVPFHMPQYALDESFSAWIGGLQAHSRITLGWIKSIENEPKRHIHAALIAAAPLDCVHAARLWRAMVAPRYSEAAMVVPYQPGLCGLGYAMKQLDSSSENIQFSGNILAFSCGDHESLFRTNAAQNRQQRRIRAQIEGSIREKPWVRSLRQNEK